ncbi:MAG: hypothetical protein LR015_06180 [Verrucomicrobia bacterium]|nr:hypothetical protein [Verrucomicrobiota bacterium]
MPIPAKFAVPPDVLALVGFDQQTGTIPVQYLQSEPSVSRIYHLETASTYVAGLVALLVLMAGLAIIYWVFIAPNFVHNLNQGGL